MASLRENDLTQGGVPRQLLRYALPMLLTSLLQAVYGIVDTVIVGHFVGSHGLSAVNNAGLVMNFLAQIAIGFAVGGNVVMGQYYGRKDRGGYKLTSGTLLLFSLLLGAAGAAVFALWARPLMAALGAPALEEAAVYLRLCALGMPAIFGYNAVSATLRALGNSRTPLVCIGISSAANVVLDLLFVAVLDRGAAGAAEATVLAQYLCFGVSLVYAAGHRAALGYDRPHRQIAGDKLKKILRVGFPVALQMTIGSISWLAVMVLINRYGVDASAGNGVSNRIKDLCQLFITATTAASSTMVAQNIGAGEYARAEKVMKTCLSATLLMAAGTIALVELLAPQLVGVFTSDAAVAEYAVKNLRLEIIAQLFYAGFMTYNVLATGCGNTVFVMANSFLNCIVVRMVLAVLLQRTLGLTGIYLACMIAPSSSVPVGYAFYKSGRWKRSPIT